MSDGTRVVQTPNFRIPGVRAGDQLNRSVFVHKEDGDSWEPGDGPAADRLVQDRVVSQNAVVAMHAVHTVKGGPIEVHDVRTDDGWGLQVAVPVTILAEEPAPLPGSYRPPAPWTNDEAAVASCPVESVSIAQVRKEDALKRKPYIEQRYTHRSDMNILELGPNYWTVIPRSLLREGSGNEYYALDVFAQGLAKQREVLDDDGGYLKDHSHQIVGDYHAMPIASGSKDVVLAFGSFDLLGAQDDVDASLSEVERVLKSGGEFVLGSAPLEQASTQTVARLLHNFDFAASDGCGPSRTLILRKK